MVQHWLMVNHQMVNHQIDGSQLIDRSRSWSPTINLMVQHPNKTGSEPSISIQINEWTINLMVRSAIWWLNHQLTVNHQLMVHAFDGWTINLMVNHQIDGSSVLWWTINLMVNHLIDGSRKWLTIFLMVNHQWLMVHHHGEPSTIDGWWFTKWLNHFVNHQPLMVNHQCWWLTIDGSFWWLTIKLIVHFVWNVNHQFDGSTSTWLTIWWLTIWLMVQAKVEGGGV